MTRDVFHYTDYYRQCGILILYYYKILMV